MTFSLGEGRLGATDKKIFFSKDFLFQIPVFLQKKTIFFQRLIFLANKSFFPKKRFPNKKVLLD